MSIWSNYSTEPIGMFLSRLKLCCLFLDFLTDDFCDFFELFDGKYFYSSTGPSFLCDLSLFVSRLSTLGDSCSLKMFC